MAQNITLMGASYSAVPAVTLPKTGGGTATFTDVSDTTAAAADVASSKYFYTAAGVRTQGTNSGGGGSGIGTLLKTEALGAFSTSSTTATDTGKTVSVTGIYGYDLLIVETSVDSVVNNRHTATINLIWLTASSNQTTQNGGTVCSNKMNMKISSSGTTTTRQSTTAYGIYVNSVSIGTGSNGTATLSMYIKYNSTQTGTINNNYTTRVYGVKLKDLIGG